MLTARLLFPAPACALLLSGTVAWAKSASTPKPSVEGFWDTPSARIKISRNGKLLTGTVVTSAKGVDLKVGQKVLQGVIEDDNVSAESRLEIITVTCKGDSTKAFLVLLLTRSGKLTGGVSTKASCASDISAIVFQRSKDQTTDSKELVTATQPDKGQYDQRGKRSAQMPPAVKALLTDGLHFMEDGQYEKARAPFAEAIATDPNVGESYNGMGASYAERNDYESAIDWYKKGLEAAPGFGDLYYNLACAYAQLGKKSLALRYFKLAAKKGYAEVDTIDGDHELDPIKDDPEYIELRRQMDAKSP